jgi:4-alpha-glucanotransferase
MNLTFRLRFHTNSGHSLFLSGNHRQLGEGNVQKAVPLRYVDPEHWELTLDLIPDADPKAPISYHYILRDADGTLVHDWGNGREMDPTWFQQRELLIIDSWNHAGFYGNVFITEPFKRVLLNANYTEVRAFTPSSATHTFRVKAPLLARGQTLCLLGEGPALGNWDTSKLILLNRHAGEDLLTVQLDLRPHAFPLAYKYGVYDIEQNRFIRYEDGANRTLHDAVAPGKHTIVNDGFAVLPTDSWKGAGVAIPVFSLRSERSFGVGEFSDLKPLADWAASAGLKLIQLLPVNDTSATHSWIDSYPYAAISAFALHPLYLNLSAMTTEPNRPLLHKLESERQQLNALQTVDYEAVMRAKLKFVRRIYPSQRKETFASPEYREFFDHNQHWLVPYAAFCYLRDRHGTSDFNQWKVHQKFSAEEIERLAEKNSRAREEIALNYFIQFHLHIQLKEATDYVRSRGVAMKGDIPIGVHRCGADTWQYPELFHMEFQAGAPPDAFAVKGQNWGFPTYNWPRMKEDGFAWWKRRFEQMSVYFDAFRVDHILGFFRIWSIPIHAVEGILGVFVPAIPVDVEEFKRRGIEFDRERFARPYISEDVLRELFGKERSHIRKEFLQSNGPGFYSLKPEFATQRQIEDHFAKLPATERFQQLKTGLFDLLSNVILFETGGADGRHLHFRYGIENTSSYKSLAPETQARLRELYIDYFFRRQETFWMHEAQQKLPELKAVTNMLMCGEDLGLVPDCVPVLMKQLGVLSLEVQRMPKQLHREFSRPSEAPYLSVVTPSTHDMSTVREWWEEDRQRIQKFYNQELHRTGESPLHCEPWVSRLIVLQHLASPAMWSIFQLQDLLGMDEQLRNSDPTTERINVPAIPTFYWRYRMHLTLETLQTANAFNSALRQCLIESGR